MKSLSATSNIQNKVRNTKLPRTKALMPLFEVVSNSIHSIQELKDVGILKNNGRIEILLIRNGDEDVLKDITDIDKYPIKSFRVSDNGIGLNEVNLRSFVEADTDHKIEIGGKGVGRFVCLKAFRELKVFSQYQKDKDTLKSIAFDFKPTKEGFHNMSYPPLKGKATGTSVVLYNFIELYQKQVDHNLTSIAREIVSHFKLYFIRKQIPDIIVRNQNNDEVTLSNIVDKEFKSEVNTELFEIDSKPYTLYLTKSFKIKSHKIFYCAHNRSVVDEGLCSRIVDLGKYSINEEGEESFYYHAYVVGDVLDKSVDTERVGFDFSQIDCEDENDIELTLPVLRTSAIECIEEMLSDFLTRVRKEKIEKYTPVIAEELPQYKNTIKHKLVEVMKLPPDLSKDKLDMELYKIDSEWRKEVKEDRIKLLEENKDITNLDDYKERYAKFLSDYNEVGMSDLARYVVHRKSVIDLLEKLIESNENNKFENEDLIHSVFFPIRTHSDEVPSEKQNLWLIDERLTYHSFLASDKTFNSIPELSSNDTDRPDLLMYNEALAFSDSKIKPHNSFTIVEFKKPMRNDYKDFDDSKNPIEQTERYIKDLLAGKVKGRNGRYVEISDKTPFYVYIVCDITPTLEQILKDREFEMTPDGKGYFKFKSKYYSAYIEVLPFEKVLQDAKQRNRILFEKLNIG